MDKFTNWSFMIIIVVGVLISVYMDKSVELALNFISAASLFFIAMTLMDIKDWKKK